MTSTDAAQTYVPAADATESAPDLATERRADEEISADAVSVLWYRSSVPQHELRNIRLVVREGIVSLTGRIRDASLRQQIEAAVRRVRGVQGVVNELKVAEQPTAL